MTLRLLIVGADGAGMSAAHQALRAARATDREVEVVVLDRGHDTSYSACGLPYLVAGDVADRDELVARTPAEHREAGIDLRLGCTAVGLDLPGRRVRVVTDGAESWQPFDQLVIATGAEAVTPPWALTAAASWIPGVRTVKTLRDGEAWVQQLQALRHNAATTLQAVVVGGGYIGVEMAEAFLRRGLEVTLVTRNEVMGTLDPDMGARLHTELERAGVHIVCHADVEGVLTDDSGHVRAVHVGDRELPADVVALGVGARPATDWLGGSLPLGEAGGLLPDQGQRVTEHVWAAGDCCEHVERLQGRRVAIALGTHATKQGRVVGSNVMGGSARFEGVLGTAITRFVAGDVHCEVSRVGPSRVQLAQSGWDVVELVTESTTAAGYMPEADPIAVKVLARRPDGLLLGMQIVGGRGAGKRIDTAATAMWAGMTVHDVAALDLSYAPPLSPTLDPVQIACRRLSEQLSSGAH